MSRAARLLIAAIALSAAGCAVAPRRAPAPDLPADLEALLPGVRARSEAARTVLAAASLTWEDPGTGQPERCSASLIYARGQGLRVIARTAAFFTVFDLVATPSRVTLDVPRERVTVAGSPEDPAWEDLPVSARPLLIALLADPWAGERSAGDGVAVFREGGERVLRGEGWTLRVDGASGRPASYEEEGVRIRWSGWARRWGVPWPHDVEIATPGGLLRAELGRLRVDRGVRADHFEAPPGEDREVLTPKEAKTRWEDRL